MCGQFKSLTTDVTDGAVIDCYPSTEHTATKNRFLHNSELMRAFHDKELEEKNKTMLKYLSEQKSSYPADEMHKEYKESRRM